MLLPKLDRLLLKRLFATYKWASYKEVPINKGEYETNFVRSSGPGGQSVNTTNSKAEIRLKITECEAIDENIIKNLRQKHANSLTKNDELIIRSQLHKSQSKNLDECLIKVKKMLYYCSIVKEEKVIEPYEESEEIREKRLASKKKRSEVKSTRQQKDFY